METRSGKSVHRFVPVLLRDGFRPACSCGWLYVTEVTDEDSAWAVHHRHVYAVGACVRCGTEGVVVAWSDVEVAWCASCARAAADA